MEAVKKRAVETDIKQKNSKKAERKKSNTGPNNYWDKARWKGSSKVLSVYIPPDFIPFKTQ